MRLRAIEKGIAEQHRSEFSSGTNHRVLFRGHPGTGKTFRLLDIGLHDAIMGKDVLYVCYNKVLASDLVRLVQMTARSARISGSIDCRHVFQIVNEKHADGYGKGGSGNEPHDTWAASVVDEYTHKFRARRGPYSTILVDEAQDLQDWAFPLIEAEAAPDASFFVADGPGQALYRPDEASWLTYFKARAQIMQLRRNFRNTTSEFLVAQCFYETAPDHDAATRFLAGRSASAHDQPQLQIELDFEHDTGTPHSVVRVDTSSADRFDDEDPLRATELRAAMVPALRRELSHALEAIQPDGQPSDILILVPSRTSSSAQWARFALTELAQVGHVSYIDYTERDQREIPARHDEIRLCTFHSSRGIEARRVIVVNFHEITWLKALLRHIGYIVLSRATERTTIVIPGGARSDALDFLERVVARVGRVDSTPGHSQP